MRAVRSAGMLDEKTAQPEQPLSLPLLFARRTRMFSLRHCRFRVGKFKENCARVVVGRQMGVACSYTLECSMSDWGQWRSVGPSVGRSVGRSLGESVGRLALCSVASPRLVSGLFAAVTNPLAALSPA